MGKLKTKHEKNRVVFLDMDGVLCTLRAVEAYGGDGGLWQHLDPVAVKLIERLLIETKAQLVLSSSWRHHHDRLSMTAILQNAGFANVPWHQNWKTPTANRRMSEPSNRGDEIKLWLETAKPDVYCIIDDFDQFHPDQRPFFVLTHETDGFSWANYKKALRILLQQPEEK